MSKTPDIDEEYKNVKIDDIQFLNDSVSEEFKKKRNYKLVILIIASMSNHYDLFTHCWNQYMNKFDGVRSFFLFCDDELECDLLIGDNSITYKCKESLVPGILYKTIAAKMFCHRYMTYDFIIRTNLSAFVHIPRLLEFMDKKTYKNLVCGNSECIPLVSPGREHERTPIIVAYEQNWIKYTSVLDNFFNDSTFKTCTSFDFLSGAFFILSYEVVDRILYAVTQQNELLNGKLYTIPDDLVITALVYRTRCSSFQYELLYDYTVKCKKIEDPKEYSDNIFFIRNKVNFMGGINDRETDIMNMVEQVRTFYSPGFLY
jgi:hypothetical protein